MSDFLRRVGWIFLAVTFIVTGLGVGVVAFWQATHPKNETQQSKCISTSVQNIETLSAPEVFKPNGDVVKLEITDLVVGNGPELKPGDCIVVKYYGTLASNGKLFEENFSAPEAFKLQIGTGQVIPGWDEGMIGMKVGGIRRLVVPSDLAYRDLDQDKIPPNSDLVFVVKLEKIDQLK